MKSSEQRAVLDPIDRLLDDGCPHYQDAEDLPVLVLSNPDLPEQGRGIDDGNPALDPE